MPGREWIEKQKTDSSLQVHSMVRLDLNFFANSTIGTRISKENVVRRKDIHVAFLSIYVIQSIYIYIYIPQERTRVPTSL